MTELERLREENAGLRRALLQLRGIYHTAAVMLERGYPPQDVARHMEDRVNAAAGEVPSRGVAAP